MTIANCSEGADLDLAIRNGVARWAREAPAVAALLDRPEAERRSAGYQHTLLEIGQQPQTWLDTAARAIAMAGELAGLTEGVQLVLTGSGSSQFAGNCLAPALQRKTGYTVRVVPSGQLIVDRQGVVPAAQRYLLVSLARSGDSPESCAAVDALLAGDPACRHLFITCNERGLLARNYRCLDNVRCLLLDSRTCDQSLVMTSSFTNMVIAGLFLGGTGDAAGYLQTVSSLSHLAQAQLLQYTQALAEVATRPFASVLFLGDGCRYGAAMESALKMLEITNGGIDTRAETFLGLRHGPMCAIHPHTLVVAFLSSEPVARAYQLDLLAELKEKGLGLCRVVTGEMAPPGESGSGDLSIDRQPMPGVDDSSAAVLDAIIGQLLAFFRALYDGFQPDSPSVNGVINRVVSGFSIHDALQGARS